MGERKEKGETKIYRCIECGTETSLTEQPKGNNNCGYRILYCSSCKGDKRHFLRRSKIKVN